MTIISCKNLHKRYSNSGIAGQKKIAALKEISFDVNRGEVFGIIGPNGAGKSTILKILLGFVHPDHGLATIKGIPSQNSLSHEFLGYLPENPTLYSNLSIVDHLHFACRIDKLCKKKAAKQISNILQKVDLEKFASLPLRQYSKGMIQRAGLAYALVLQPELLILDEPMSGLDPMGRKLVLDIINEYHQSGTTILFCSHILTDVERVCDRIAIMNLGQLIDITTPANLSKKYSESTATPCHSSLETYFLHKINGHIDK